MSYFAKIVYNGDGTTTAFVIPFPYIQETDVTAFIGGIPFTGVITYPDGTHINLSPAPPAGTGNVVIQRRSVAAAVMAQVQNGTIRPADLNLNATQYLYLDQERLDDYADMQASLTSAQAALAAVTNALALSGSPGFAFSPQIFGTVALAAAANLSPVNFVEVAGYYSPGDGGGARYVKAQTSGAGTGKFQSLDGQWWILAGPPWDFRQFGCKVDGATNDSTAANAAITYVSGLGGGTISWRGQMVAQITLQNGVVLTGGIKDTTPNQDDGVEPTRLIPPAGVTGWTITTPSAGGLNCGAAGLAVTGVGASQAIGGIKITAGSVNCCVKNCDFDQFANQAIVDYGIGSYIKENIATNCLLNRSPGTRVGVLELHGSDGYVFNNEMSASLASLNSSNLYIVGLWFVGGNYTTNGNIGEFSDVGIWFDCYNGSHAQDRGSNNWGPGCVIDQNAATLVGCKAYENSQSASAAYSGFQSVAGAPLGRLIGCLAFSSAAPSHAYGFDLSVGGGNGAGDRIVCKGCFSFGHATATVNQQAQYPAVFDVDPVLVAGAGDKPNLDGTRLYEPTDTSSVNYTGVTGVVVGNVYTFVGNSHVTLKNNDASAGYVPFINNTGADIVMTSGKLYQYMALNSGASNAAQLVELSGT